MPEVLDSDVDAGRGRELARQLKLPFVSHIPDQASLSAGEAASDRFYLQYREDGLQLIAVAENQRLETHVDFDSPALRHRARTGLLGQPLIKALGVKKDCFPCVIDATAGFAKDAYLIARAGCQITMFERSPVISALLADGISRAKSVGASLGDKPVGGEDQKQHLQAISRITLVEQDFLNAGLQKADVVYLDPMFPEKKKSAQVKKDMYLLQRYFHSASMESSNSEDESFLFEKAMATAIKRVVVKRPRLAPELGGGILKPSFQYRGKTNRYDVYLRG